MRTLPMLAALGLAALSSGCATANCKAYLNALEDCTSEANGEEVNLNPTILPGFGFCDIYTGPLSIGIQQPDWACKADAYRDADCSTQEGFDAANEADNDCDQG